MTLPKRISDQKMEEFANTNGGNNTGAERTSEPHIVVECPSCSTKFAVESTLVASYEIPRFHCSRCDAIFELKQTRPTTPPSNQTSKNQGDDQPSTVQSPDPTQTPTPTPTSGSVQRWTLSDSNPRDPQNDDAARPSSALEIQAPLKSTDFTLGTIPNPDTLEPRHPFDPIEDRAGLSILGFRPSASRRHSTSLTRSETQSLVAGIKPAPNQIEEQKPALTPKAELNAEPKADTKTLETPKAPPTQNIPSLRDRFSERTRGLLKLSIPVATALGLLCVVSLCTRFMPLATDSVFGSIIPGFITGRTSHLPPQEISVRDLTLQLEKTQSKETLPVIRGFVSNASDTTFEDVSIEALGFNAHGELIVRARAPLRSALSREKISDLSLDTVKKFQNAISASDASIKPGEKVAFAVALFLQDAAPQEVTYFSARVFSVGRSR
jgi:hypothetical protein